MKQHDLTEGNILTTLLGFAIPVFASLFLQAMYGAVDLLVVGKFATIADQSGVATGSMFTTTFANVITSFAMGVTVLIAEAIGSRRYERASQGIGTGITLFAIISVISTVCLVCLSKKIAILMNAPENALPQTTSYIRICGAGILFIISYNVLGAIFRGIGDSKTPLITVAIACAVNIIADLVFVIVFKMGAAGAALATVLAQAISVIISLIIIAHKKLPFKFYKKDIKVNPVITKVIFKIGAPIALQDLLVGFSFIFIQATVNSIGVVESAAIGVGEKVCAFLMLVSVSYMQSMATIVAQNNGAGKYQRAKQALKYGIESSLVAGIIMGALAFFTGNHLAAIFSNDTNVILSSHLYLKAYSIDCIFTAILFCFIGYFNGCEKTLFVMIQGLVGSFFIRVPLVYLFKKFVDNSLFLIGLATPISSVVQIILSVFAFVIYEKKDKLTKI